MSIKTAKSSRPFQADPDQTFDRLAGLLDKFHVQASLFHTGPLCGLQRFEAVTGRAFVHVLRAGKMRMRYEDLGGMQVMELSQPTLLFFPRPVPHEFLSDSIGGADFTCATLDFDGGLRNPIVQSLPSLVAIPLSEIEGIQPTLALLFAEADRPRCGSRLLANRLFEVVLIQILRWIIDHPSRAGVSQGMMRGLSDPRLAKSLIALHDAPEKDWPLERMASIAGMSRSAFAAAFKEATGTTPAVYLLDWRVGLASALLRAGRSVKQVSIELGFPDAASLSKAFRRRTGTSARQWLAAQSSDAP